MVLAFLCVHQARVAFGYKEETGSQESVDFDILRVHETLLKMGPAD